MRLHNRPLPTTLDSSVFAVHQAFIRTLHYLNDAEKERIHKAVAFGYWAHDGQKRADGTPYISHPLAVSTIIAQLKLDADTLIAGLLHDTLEDCPRVNFEYIENIFGYRVAFLVDAVTKLSHRNVHSRTEASNQEQLSENFKINENLQRLMLSSSKDLRSLFIKLADRLHNIRTLGNLEPAKQKRIAKETRDVYVPLASLLGVSTWRDELEDITFRVLNPKDHQHITQYLKKIKTEDNQRIIDDTSHKLEQLLRDQSISYVQVYGRIKSPASVYQKSRAKSLDLHNVMDLVGFRIILNSQRFCYAALGALHNTFKHVPGTFDDYISSPRGNGYRSLHTVVRGIDGLRIEVQIRSRGMHKIAEFGAAAHWRYKNELAMTPDALNLIAQIQEDVQKAKMSRIIMGEINLAHFSEEVVVYTPKGGLVRLPAESTVLDFAFRIHTEVGLHFKQAYVNNALVSMQHVVKRGDTVEIITDPGIKPQIYWLSHAKSHRARGMIRQAIAQQEASELTTFAANLARQFNQRLSVSIDYQSMRRLYSDLQIKDLEDLEDKIISAKIPPEKFLGLVQPNINLSNTDSEEQIKRQIETLFQRVIPCPHCLPLPGDTLEGTWQFEKGSIAHRPECHKLQVYKENYSSLTDICLEPKRDNKQRGFPCLIDLSGHNSPGLLGIFCSTFGEFGIDIEELRILRRSKKIMTVRFQIHIAHKSQLDDLMNTLERREVNFTVHRPIFKDIYASLSIIEEDQAEEVT